MKSVNQTIKEGFFQVIDGISDVTGFAAFRIPLGRAKTPREVTLALSGYQQIDSFSCGAVAAAMAGKFLCPQIKFERIYAAVNPTREHGAGNARVTRGLRSLGVRVSWRKNLKFDDICDAIDAKSPMLVSIKTGDSESDHWVVLYGYGRRPDLVFVAGRGIPFITGNRIGRRKLRSLWAPPGEGLVCSKATQKSTRRG